MKKQTKVLVAAALLTLGASFSALAAETKGTWVLNDEGWQYADKDGEYVEEKWCMSNGIEFWINDEEVLGASEWVKEGSYTYYVQSDGSKTKNAWKYLYDIKDEDEEGDQYWYYFDAKGRMVEGKKKDIDGYTYYFNNKGQMLTGWVDAVNFEKAAYDEQIGNLVFTNEDGQTMKSTWLKEFPWSKDADEWYEGEDEKDYYADAKGKLYNTKKDVDGLTYFFDATTGQMMTGWVIKNLDGVYTVSNADHNKTAIDSTTALEAYWTSTEGYAKKNSWREAKNPADDKTYWYHFDKLGRAFLATTSNTIAVDAASYDFDNGEDLTRQFKPAAAVKVESKKINGKEYFFNQKGQMINGLQMIDSKLVYLEDGVKVTGEVTLTDNNENDYEFLFAEKTEKGQTKYAAVNGYFEKYLYVNGQLIKSEDSDTFRKETVGTKTYIVDYKGRVQHKDGEDYGLAATGKVFNFNEDDSIKEEVVKAN